QQDEDRRRARSLENINADVLLMNFLGGMFFTANGIVREANGGARQILGFASQAGMGTREIFRDASLGWDESGSGLTETLAGYLRENVSCGRLEARYLTPAGQLRLLDITLS